MKFFMALALCLTMNSAMAAEALICNGGALVVTSTTEANRYVITVYNPEVIQYFSSQMKKTQTTYLQNTTFNSHGAMVISGAMLTRNGKNLVTGQFGPELRIEGQTAKLIINKVKMTSSRSYEHYEIANWYFDSCR